MGNQLYYHAWELIFRKSAHRLWKSEISFGKSQILLRDYKENTKSNMSFWKCAKRWRGGRGFTARQAETVHFGLGYSRDEFGGGFTVQNARPADEYYHGHL